MPGQSRDTHPWPLFGLRITTPRLELRIPDDEDLAELFAALKRWPLERGRKITFEYVLIEGVNDTSADAVKLAALVRPMPAKVNLIPLNESKEWLPDLKRPSDATVNAFAEAVAGGGVPVTVRWSKGLQADAACGQLKGREEPRRPRSR